MIYRLFLRVIFCLLIIGHLEATQLKICIFSEQNGRGLEIDQKILADALKELGHEVYLKGLYDTTENASIVDINIFFQVINVCWFPYASSNWFIPNPEWYVQELELLDRIDLILCRTNEVERIFQSLNKKTYFLGFTTIDCYDASVKKKYGLFFHLAGASDQKGTLSILDIWQRNPQFPYLTIIKHNCSVMANQSNLKWIPYRVSKSNLQHLQNSHGVHLCLSETEGFGHYLMEGMSTGAVIVTTDAPPMNEFITDKRCLVPYKACETQRLGVNYYVDTDQLELTLNHLRNLPIEELIEIGTNNRAMYLKKAKEFKRRLKKLVPSST